MMAVQTEPVLDLSAAVAAFNKKVKASDVVIVNLVLVALYLKFSQ